MNIADSVGYHCDEADLDSSRTEPMSKQFHANRVPTESAWRSWDGTPMFYQAWLPEGRPEGAIVLFHRGHEHSGRWQDFVDRLDLSGFAVFAWDARGHGRSTGERGFADSFGTLVRDADAFVQHVRAQHGIATHEIVVVAQSVGAVIAAAWLHDYAPPIRALVLGSPAFRVRLYVPFALPLLRVLLKIWPKLSIRSYVKGKLLTHDPIRQREYDTDPLITRAISVRVLTGLHDTGTRLLQDAEAIVAPVLMFTSGDDRVVKRRAQHEFFRGLGSIRKEEAVLAGFLHDIFGEAYRQLPITRARRFILSVFDNPQPMPDLLVNDQYGQRRTKYDVLARPATRLSPRRFGHALMRLALATIGRLSEGIRLGQRTGFDSGAMLDYVYRNQASGLTPLGRMIDRAFLDSIGWRCIRQRRANVTALLGTAMRHVAKEGRAVRLLDIAAGHGRYVIDALLANPGLGAETLFRDYSMANLEAARQLSATLKLSRASFEVGDAFDAKSIAQIRPRPTIAVVSGLYELYPDNAMVGASLSGLAHALGSHGYLVYTNQPWHPQLEFIARVLTSHRDGAPWIMRCRSQAEMDSLVGSAGFEKLSTVADDEGIFTVSLARRVDTEGTRPA